jgi:hypothetical protein
MLILSLGVTDAQVSYLQHLLNHALRSTPGRVPLSEDGVFGQKTDTAVRLFQSSYRGSEGRLKLDGIVGPKTWRALGLVNEVSHNLPRVGQNTMMSCWVVSAGLATRRMASIVPATAKFLADGGLVPSRDNLQAFANELRMQLLPGVPLIVDQLFGPLQRGPILMVGRKPAGLHAVVISAYYGGIERTTKMIQIHNPSPLGRGSIEVTHYPEMVLENMIFDPVAMIVS